MESARIRQLLQQVARGDLSVEAAMEAIRTLPFDELGYACIDSHRELRRGFPEVVFCPGKTGQQVAEILRRIADSGSPALATRAGADLFAEVEAVLPEARYHPEARMISLGEPPPVTAPGPVLVVSAGTSDIPAAEEAALTARWTGSRVERIYDVGAAGIHRLLAQVDRLREARVVVVAAGMDGVLPSVVAGLVRAPVVALPTSVGYGAGAGGIAPLLTMLNCCSPGVAVVNIDNGFGAGYLAGRINRLREEA